MVGSFIFAAVLLLAGVFILYFGRILLVRGLSEREWVRIAFGSLVSLIGLGVFVLGFVALFTAFAL